MLNSIDFLLCDVLCTRTYGFMQRLPPPPPHFFANIANISRTCVKLHLEMRKMPLALRRHSHGHKNVHSSRTHFYMTANLYIYFFSSRIRRFLCNTHINGKNPFLFCMQILNHVHCCVAHIYSIHRDSNMTFSSPDRVIFVSKKLC